MTKQIVLKLLREHTEEFLSGEAISRQAGVSRAAVWKAVEQLRQEGYGIESVPNRGYRLTRVTARLRPEELAEQFRDCRIGRELLYFDTIDSTNNELKRRAGPPGTELCVPRREGTVFIGGPPPPVPAL